MKDAVLVMKVDRAEVLQSWFDPKRKNFNHLICSIY